VEGKCEAVRRAAVAAVVGLLVFSAVAPTPALGSAGEEAELLSLVNGLRSSRGLRTLAVDPELRALAEDWAQRMAAARNIFHSPLDTRVRAAWVHLGENVAVDVSVVAAERTLEVSPEHLANLVSPAYDYIGIGVAHGADGGVYVVQDFMQLATSPPRQSSPNPPPAVAARPIAPSRRSGTPKPSPPPPPSPGPAPSPPLPAPPEPPQPSVRLAAVFDRLRGLDAYVVTRQPRRYGLVRRNW
jgi:hypothetical protein